MATYCDLRPVETMALWLDAMGWRPHSDEKLFPNNITNRISRELQEIATTRGIDASLISPHSLRTGCATTLYTAGINPTDIQRWGRWKSSIYMRYIWHGDFRLHHLCPSLTAPTRLTDHLRVDLDRARGVQFNDDFKMGGSGSGFSEEEGKAKPDPFNYQSESGSGGSKKSVNQRSVINSSPGGNPAGSRESMSVEEPAAKRPCERVKEEEGERAIR